MNAFDSETIFGVRYQFDRCGSTQSIGAHGAILHDQSIGSRIPDTFAKSAVGIECPGAEFALAGIPSDSLEALHEDLVTAGDIDIADDEVAVIIPAIIQGYLGITRFVDPFADDPSESFECFVWSRWQWFTDISQRRELKPCIGLLPDGGETKYREPFAFLVGDHPRAINKHESCNGSHRFDLSVGLSTRVSFLEGLHEGFDLVVTEVYGTRVIDQFAVWQEDGSNCIGVPCVECVRELLGCFDSLGFQCELFRRDLLGHCGCFCWLGGCVLGNHGRARSHTQSKCNGKRVFPKTISHSNRPLQ